MYYRLWDLQTSRYMATGYNCGLKELREQYRSYISIDSDDEELIQYDKLSDEEVLNYIRNNEFDIDDSELPFEDYDWYD